MTSQIEDAKTTFLNTKVRLPGAPDPDAVGTVVDIYPQPGVDLSKKNRPLTFLSDDEIPDSDGNYPKQITSPKILCVVRFDGYKLVAEPGDLVKVDAE